MILPLCVLIGIERRADTTITNGVGEDLKSAAVEFVDGFGVFRGIPKQLAG